MKKTVLFNGMRAMALALTAALGLAAQAADTEKTVCVGDVYSTPKSAYSGRAEGNYGVVTGYYGQFYSQSVYTVTDLNLGETGSINLTKIKYEMNKGYEAKTLGVEVYVGETAVDEVMSWAPVQLAGQTKVFDGNWAFAMGDNVIEVPFAEPFVYDTSKNLVVTVVKKDNASSYTFNWKWFDTPNGHKQFVQGGFAGWSSSTVDRNNLGGSGEDTDAFVSLPVIKLSYNTGAAGEEPGGESTIKTKEICIGDKQSGPADGYGGRVENNVGPLAGYYGAYFSQSLYTAADLNLGVTETVNLSKILYNVHKGYEAKTLPVEVYVGMTDVDEIMSWSPVQLDKQTLVYDGDWVFNMGDNVIEVPFSAPFALEPGKNLVVTVIKKNSASTYAINWKWFDSQIGHKQYLHGSSVDKSYLSGEDSFKSVPVMTLQYSLASAGEVKIVDLAANALSVPATMTQGVAADFSVDVVNRGTEAVAGFTVELLDRTNPDSTLVLASTVVTDSLAAQAQLAVPFSIAVDSTGVYRFAARVILEGDTEAANDTTPDVAVEVSMKKPDDIRSQALNTWETWEEEVNGNVNVVGSNTNDFIPGSGVYRMSAAQFIYTAQQVDMVRPGQIYSLSFFLKKYDYTAPEAMHYKVYLGTTDKTGYDDRYALTGQTLVYEGDKTFYPCEDGAQWQINFQTPFAYDNTRNLVVTVVSETQTVCSIMPFVRCNKGGDVKCEVSYQSGSSFDFFSQRGYLDATQPVASIEYTLDPIPQFVDVAVGSLTESVAFNPETRQATYAATVSNLGTMDVEGFTVEVVNLTDSVPAVLASRHYDRTLAAEGTFNAKVTVDFTEEGRYSLAARVVLAEGVNDVNPDNNLSPDTLAFEYIVPRFVDLAVGNLALETEFDEATRRAVFSTGVTNLGNLDVHGFTVEVFSVADSVETVLATESVNTILVPESCCKVTVPVTFEDGGLYKLGVRVIVDDDVNPADNVSTETLEFAVPEVNSLGNLAAGTLAYADGALQLGGLYSRVAVYDTAGRLLFSASTAGRRTLALDLRAGLYTVVAKTADGRTATLKFVK